MYFTRRSQQTFIEIYLNHEIYVHYKCTENNRHNRNATYKR